MFHIARTPLLRRTFLHGLGTTLALPFLDAMRPVFGAAAASATEPPRRMLAICTNLGVLERYFYPATTGRDYALTPYLEILKDFRDQFTIFSGTSLTDVTGGHSAEATFLTGAPHLVCWTINSYHIAAAGSDPVVLPHHGQSQRRIP